MALRFLTSVTLEHGEMREKVSGELWMSIWAQGEKISKPQNVLVVAEKTDTCAEQVQGLPKKTSIPKVKERVKGDLQGSLQIGGAHLGAQIHVLFGFDQVQLLVPVGREVDGLCLQPLMPDLKDGWGGETQTINWITVVFCAIPGLWIL